MARIKNAARLRKINTAPSLSLSLFRLREISRRSLSRRGVERTGGEREIELFQFFLPHEGGGETPG